MRASSTAKRKGFDTQSLAPASSAATTSSSGAPAPFSTMTGPENPSARSDFIRSEPVAVGQRDGEDDEVRPAGS